MIDIDDIQIIDLDGDLTRPHTHNGRRGWRFYFRLSEHVTREWEKLFNGLYNERSLFGFWPFGPTAYVRGNLLWFHGLKYELKYLKGRVDKYVAKTNEKYLRWWEAEERKRLQKEVEMDSMRRGLFGRKRK